MQVKTSSIRAFLDPKGKIPDSILLHKLEEVSRSVKVHGFNLCHAISLSFNSDDSSSAQHPLLSCCLCSILSLSS